MERIYGLLDVRGVAPEEIRAMPGLGEVYGTESRATDALFNFYRKIGGGDFGAAVTACRKFAHADAARLRLRARLRAEAIVAGSCSGEYRGRVYVEAGYIHLALYTFLKGLLRKEGVPVMVRPRFLLADALKELAGPGAPRQLYSPGDILTLRAVFNAFTSREGEKLLAARAIIYSALLGKKEKVPTGRVPYPHLSEEVRLLKYVNGLDFGACKNAFAKYLRRYSL